MAIKNLYAILSPVEDGKEHLEHCPKCRAPLIHIDPDELYKHAAEMGIKPNWYMVRYERAEKIDIQPMFEVKETVEV